jgi:hypothetical protein
MSTLLSRKLQDRQREKFPHVDDKHRAQKVETARRWIFTKGVRIGADSIRDLLQSLTPTRVWHNIYDTLTLSQNTFSQLLGPLGIDFYSLFVVDLLHEFELGVWKAIFTHLIRILYAQGGNAVQKLNER